MVIAKKAELKRLDEEAAQGMGNGRCMVGKIQYHVKPIKKVAPKTEEEVLKEHENEKSFWNTSKRKRRINNKPWGLA